MTSYTAPAVMGTGDKGIKRRVDNRWTKEEDEILFERVTASGPLICWCKVAEALPGRNNKACRKRWIHSLDPNLRKGRWSQAEDAALKVAVKLYGEQWYQVARTLKNGRTDDQCAKRWREALDPNIRKDRWTEEEDRLLMATYAKCGRRWNEISRVLNGRPSVQCRNRFMSLQKPGKEDTFDVSQRTSPVSDFSSSFEPEDYESSSIASSRRSSLSSDFSFTPSTPSPLTSYPSSDFRFHPPTNWQTTRADMFQPLPPSPQYKSSFENSSCCWNEPYQLRETDRYSIVDSREAGGYQISHSNGPPGPVSIMNCNGNGRDASASSTTSSVDGGPMSLGPYSHTYNAPFLMTCPLPNCAYLNQSLVEIWRHVTWVHVCSYPYPSSSCFGNEDNSIAVVAAVERFVLGS